MNENVRRTLSTAAGAVVIGGLLVVALPQHGVSVVRLVLVTGASAAALYALNVTLPHWSTAGWWNPPSRRALGRTARSGRSGRLGRSRRRSRELERIHSRLSGRRWPLEGAPPLPPDALYMLKPLIEAALEREGVDLDDAAQREAARSALAPVTWTVLTSDLLQRPRWFRTVRPDERAVAAVVHRVLDDLERLGGDGQGSGVRTDGNGDRSAHTPSSWEDAGSDSNRSDPNPPFDAIHPRAP